MAPPRLDSPWPWLAALAALALVLAARRGPAARAWWSGTLELWRTLARDPRAVHGARRRPPAAVVCAAAALLAGGWALAGARAPADHAARVWSVHVDVSPSMHLAWAAPGEVPGAGAPTRLERALEQAVALLDELDAAPARTRWRRTLDGTPEEVVGDRPPQAWLQAPRAPQPAPAWIALDRTGTLWVSDDAGGAEPRHALAALAGGAAVAGPVAALGRARLTGDPTRLELAAEPVAAPRLFLADGLRVGALARAAEAWAAARGLRVVTDEPAELSLTVAAPGTVGEAELRGARDGWTWTLGGARGTPRGSPWLTAGEAVLVAWVPGGVELAGTGLGEPEGDPAAFAAAWAELLDRAALPPVGVVSVDERAAAGEARTLRPPHDGPLPAPAEPPGDSDGGAAQAMAAALLGGAALALAARG